MRRTAKSAAASFVLLLCLLPLAGCGSTTYPNATGSWTMAAVSGVILSAPPQSFTGTLTSTGGTVNATLTFSNSCFHGQALAYTGSIGDGNVLKLTSATYDNQSVQLTGTLSTDGSLLTSGSYTVSAANLSQGICDTGDTGSLSGGRVTSSQ